MKLIRREFLHGTLASSALLGLSGCVPLDQSPRGRREAALQIYEANAGGTLGVSLLNIASGQSMGVNQGLRFGHCSSFKLTLAAMVLHRHAMGIDDADRRVTWSQEDLLSYAPFTRERLDYGATLRELAEHTQKLSDNTAANLILQDLGDHRQSLNSGAK